MMEVVQAFPISLYSVIATDAIKKLVHMLDLTTTLAFFRLDPTIQAYLA